MCHLFQVVKNKGSDFRSDTWSLGCVVPWQHSDQQMVAASLCISSAIWQFRGFTMVYHGLTRWTHLNPKVFQVLTGLLPFYGGYRPRLVEIWCEVVVSVFAKLVFLGPKDRLPRLQEDLRFGQQASGFFFKELSYWNETELIHIPHSTLWSICSHGRFHGFSTCYP